MTSEVRRILSGVLHTGIECSLCDRAKTERKKNIFHKDEKASGKSNVFLFLTVPVPTLDETDLSYLGNGVKQKIIVNEILEGQTVSSYALHLALYFLSNNCFSAEVLTILSSSISLL